MPRHSVIKWFAFAALLTGCAAEVSDAPPADEGPNGETAEALKPRPATLGYFGAYNDADNVAEIRASAAYSNLVWLGVADPRVKDPKKKAKREAAMNRRYDAVRAFPHLRVLLIGASPWGNDFEHTFAQAKAYYDAIVSSIPDDIKDRIVAVNLADEPFLNRLGRADEIRTKLEKASAYFHEALPKAATHINFSFVELNAGVALPQHADWVGFDCYIWMDGCSNFNVVENYVHTLEQRVPKTTRIVLVPDAHRHTTKDSADPVVNALGAYYGLARRDPRVVAITPFAATDYPGVIGFQNTDPASTAIRQKVKQIGKQFVQ